MDWELEWFYTERRPAARFTLVDKAAPPQAQSLARVSAGGMQRKEAWSTTSHWHGE